MIGRLERLSLRSRLQLVCQSASLFLVNILLKLWLASVPKNIPEFPNYLLCAPLRHAFDLLSWAELKGRNHISRSQPNLLFRWPLK